MEFIQEWQKVTWKSHVLFWRHLVAKIQRALTNVLCTNCTTTFSTTLFLCPCYKTRITALKYNHACNNVPSQLEWIWNWSFIGQWLNQAKNHWWKIKLQHRLFLDVFDTYNVHISHLYIKEWRLEEEQDSTTILKAPKLCQNCSASKVHLEFQFSSYIFEILKVLRVCIWFALWTPLIVYQVFSLKHFHCNFVW